MLPPGHSLDQLSPPNQQRQPLRITGRAAASVDAAAAANSRWRGSWSAFRRWKAIQTVFGTWHGRQMVRQQPELHK
jgi:hypothetical protein